MCLDWKSKTIITCVFGCQSWHVLRSGRDQIVGVEFRYFLFLLTQSQPTVSIIRETIAVRGGQLVPTPNRSRCYHCPMSSFFCLFQISRHLHFEARMTRQEWSFPMIPAMIGQKGVEIEITQSWFRYFEHNLHSIPSPIPFQLLLKATCPNPLESHKSQCS